MRALSALFYVISAIFIGMGFHKIHVYEHSEYSPSGNVNSYVGGDAYNFIINSGYATAYFVLATLFVILGSFMLILDRLDQKELSNDTKDDKVIE